MDEKQHVTAWRDARELEYARIDEALRARMQYTTIRNIYMVAQQPEAVLKMVELDNDIWECFRHHLDKKDDVRKSLETEIDTLTEEAGEIYEENRGKNEIDDPDRIKEFLRRERRFYSDVMDIRHELGMDLAMKVPFTKRDKVKALQGIASGKFDD